MMAMMRTMLVLALALGAAGAGAAGVDEKEAALIRKNLAERLPLLGKIDEVSKSPVAGIYEIRVGFDILYTDAKGDYVFQGNLLDARHQRNLTEERQEKLLNIDFSSLPVKDAFTIVRGNGKRKLAVFEDPNCPYCKQFEQELQKVNDVTVYMFLMPILGPDSEEKSRNLWCAKDRGAAWLDWMLRAKPAREGKCDVAALTRNVDYGRKWRITGTPTMVFADGSRVSGAVASPQIEKLLAEKK